MNFIHGIASREPALLMVNIWYESDKRQYDLYHKWLLILFSSQADIGWLGQRVFIGESYH